MLVRVIIGGTPLARRFARELDAWPGKLYVLVGDETAAERLRDDGIAATHVDLDDAEAVRSSVTDPDIVFVVSETPTEDGDRLTVAGAAFPDARLVAVSPAAWPEAAATATQHLALDQLRANDLLDELESPAFRRSLRLLRTIGTLDEPIAVVMHDNPDPDAIASAIGMTFMADAVGREAVALYAGEISHQENRAFVNLLELDLETYEPPLDVDAYGSIVLVDHAHPGVNDQLPETAAVDVIIDHHPAREEADAVFVDRRHDVGATSTLVAEHLLNAQLEPDSTLASALWYGIQVDTDGFRRGVSELDFETAARLRAWVDDGLLSRIESPQMTAGTIDTIGRAIANRQVHDDVLITCAGDIQNRDALAQAADDLLMMEGISIVLVYGWVDGVLYASARSRNDNVDVGDAIRLAYGQIGHAGGHEDMAGAQIPPTVMLPHTGTTAEDRAVEEVITDRFLEGVDMASRPLPSGYLEGEDPIEG